MMDTPTWKFALGSAKFVRDDGSVVDSLTLDNDGTTWKVDGTRLGFWRIEAAMEHVENVYAFERAMTGNGKE